MAFENNQYNNRDRKDIRTNGYTLRNVHAIKPTAMKIMFYNDMLRLSFIPPLPEDRRGDNKYFDYGNEIITNISRKNCNLLLKMYEESIKPAIDEGKQIFKSVEIGENKNHIGLSSGVSLGQDGKAHPYLILIRSIDPNTKTSNDVILYEFEKATVYTDYNPITGEHATVEEVNNELDMFIKDLDTFRAASSKAYVHAARVVDDAYKTMMSGLAKDTATKVGVDISQYTWTSGQRGNSASGYGYGSIFNSGGSNDDPLPFDNESNTRQVSSMDDMEQFMMN